MNLHCAYLLFIISACISFGMASDADSTAFVLLADGIDQTSLHFCLTNTGRESSKLSSITDYWMPLVTMDTVGSDTQTNGIKVAVLLNAIAVPQNIDPQLFLMSSGYEHNSQLVSSLSHAFPSAMFAQLTVKDFSRLVELSKGGNSTNSLTVQVVRDYLSPNPVYSFYLVLTVYMCAFASILMGSAIVFVTRDELLKQLRDWANTSKTSNLVVCVGIGLFIAFASGCLLIYYFFYDIAVYIAIALYSLVGVLAVTHVLAFWIMYFCSGARKTFPVDCSLCRWHVTYSQSVTQLCILPFSITLMITWLIFRNDPTVGWPIQSFIGVLLISRILSAGLPLPSLKMITIVFFAFLLYDVFFVFVTPLFVPSPSSASHPPQTVTPVPPAPTQSLLRQARSVSEPQSYMEAIATGSAGQSGEALPVSFRLLARMPGGLYNCDSVTYRALLGYGDAVFPGFLSTYLAFFDSVWQIRFRRNFVASLAGYLLGGIVTQAALSFMTRAQPALLYLCPCTLGFTVLVCVIFGGVDELRRLWRGTMPTFTAMDVVMFPPDDPSLSYKDSHIVSAFHGDDLSLNGHLGDELRHTQSDVRLVSPA